VIVGCYTMHLYCDHAGHVSHRGGYHDEYTGQTAGACRKEARQEGWLFDLDHNTVYCHDCQRVALRDKRQKLIKGPAARP
jgi:hypothetical protein